MEVTVAQAGVMEAVSAGDSADRAGRADYERGGRDALPVYGLWIFHRRVKGRKIH